jgi:protein O-GlcNAc transferase
MFDWLKAIRPSRRDKPGAAVAQVSADAPLTGNGPESASAENKSCGDKYFKEGELGRAEECYRQALAVNPGYAEAFNALGNALGLQGKHGEALASYQDAIRLKPDYAGAYNNLGGVLHQQGNLADAVACYRKSIALKPGYPGAHTNLGIALTYLGEVEAALESYRVALSLDPNDVDAHSNRLLIMHYFDDIPPSAIFDEHLRFARQFEAPLKARWARHANLRDPEKRLKVGYVSPDFRNHSVAYFIEPILERHDKSRVEVFCYYNHADQDGVTGRIRRAADHWISCVGMSDEALAERIRADGIDILVDLAGHTAHNRMLTFARKPAPVQVTYLGYPARPA